MEKLKQEAGYFNRQRMTLLGRLRGDPEHLMSASDRAMWARMRMDPTDILDVTGSTYTYLVNGHGPANWTGLFSPGERVRLKIINASAMSIFNARPGLPMTVVNTDGQNVRPVEIDEFRISVAETYDVIVRPTEDRAFTFVAEAIDRSAWAAPRAAAGHDRRGAAAEDRPLLTMRDMGMGRRGHGSRRDGGDGPWGAGRRRSRRRPRHPCRAWTMTCAIPPTRPRSGSDRAST